MKKTESEQISRELRRIEESAMYGAEAQFEYAKKWRRVDRLLAALAAVGAGISGVGVLTEVLGATAAGVIAIASAGVGAVAASLNAPQTKERAAGSANAYRALQQDARVLRSVDLNDLGLQDARAALKQLVDRLQDLNETSEIPSDRAWKKAKSQIDRGSQEYEVDD